MKFPGFATLTAAAIVVSVVPVSASDAETAAWASIQKINEMAEETRNRCASGQSASCTEATTVSGMSFTLVQDAKRCASGRYPITCNKLATTIAEIDALYEAYRADVGPARVASNKVRLQCQSLPFGGSCESSDGIVQTQLTAPQQ